MADIGSVFGLNDIPTTKVTRQKLPYYAVKTSQIKGV